MKGIALLLVLLGVAGLYFGLFGYTQTTAEINIAGVEAQASERRTVPALAIVGGIFVVGGVILLAKDGRKA